MENMKFTHNMLNTLIKNPLSPLTWCFWTAFVLLITIILTGCAATHTPQKKIQREKTTTRHESKWDRAKSFSIEGYHVYLGILNDDENLYIHLVTTDNDIQQSITTSGCTIWVDAAGGLEKIYGIHYPALTPPTDAEQPTGSPTPTSSNEKKAGAPDEQAPQTLEIVSNGGDERTRITINEAMSLGIKASIISTNRYLMYDLTIPYTEIIAHHGLQMSRLPQSIAIALEIEGVTPVKSEKSETVKSGSKGQKGQGGGRRGGGMGGGGGGGMRGGDKPKDIQKTESHKPVVKETLEKWFILNL